MMMMIMMMMMKIANFHAPPAFDAPVRGVPVAILL